MTQVANPRKTNSQKRSFPDLSFEEAYQLFNFVVTNRPALRTA